MPKSVFLPKDETKSLYLLPAFDEFMVAYKDRRAALDADRTKEAITGNGIFKPIIVVDGRIAGVWKRSFKKDSVIIEKILFADLNDSEHEVFQKRAQEYAGFEGKNAKF